MSELAAFYASIRECHDEDAPRLVFADWLEENGDDHRAAFIRAQCASADASLDDDVRFDAETRSNALFDRHGKQWRAELPQFDGLQWEEFRRGFPLSVSAQRWDDFLRTLPELWQKTPVAALGVRPGHMEGEESVAQCRFLEMAKRELLRPLKCMHIADPAWTDNPLLTMFYDGYFSGLHDLAISGDSRLPVLFTQWPGLLPSLRRLDLSLWRPPRHGWNSMTSGHEWPELRQIRLDMNHLNREATVMLLSRHFPKLSDLDLSMNDIDRNFAFRVEESPLSALRSLNLSGNTIGDQGLRSFAGVRGLARLETLDLANCAIGRDGVAALAASPHFPALRSLNLSRNGFGDDAIDGLVAMQSPIRELRLDGNRLNSSGVRRLVEWPGFAALESLDLSGNLVGDVAIHALMSIQQPIALRKLRLRGAGVSWRGAAKLADWPVADQLTELELNDNPIGPMGVRSLFQSRYFTKLRCLSLPGCGVTSAEIPSLFAHPTLPHLRSIDLNGNDDIDPAAYDRLVEHFDRRIFI